MLLVFGIVGLLWIATKNADDHDAAPDPHQQISQPGRSQARSGFTLTPAAQQSAMLAALRQEVRPLWLNSLWALGPGAEAYLAQQNSEPDEELAVEIQTLMAIMQGLPQGSWQKFINGVVGAHSEDAAFTNQVVAQAVRSAANTSQIIGGIIGNTRTQGKILTCRLDDNCVVVHAYASH